MQHMQERDGQHTTVYGMFAGMEKLERYSCCCSIWCGMCLRLC